MLTITARIMRAKSGLWAIHMKHPLIDVFVPGYVLKTQAIAAARAFAAAVGRHAVFAVDE